ncbi:hypothetical protein N7931_04660 [Catenovulum sp. 2E275]|uniref:hypothetical protein n=1 Tax=Catenovulum sp. 2E275 TaxID=2980497 RepID=UPI0021D31EDA|nr:hypothetical protein [Catenovulum sp. 2E275]MCU4674919.1 hypothetical protein [Catenovulum sp. 2E275]
MSELKINWITIEHASEMTGASVAIIQDAIRKYQNKPEALTSKIENGTIFVDKSQILALFSSSANPINKDKIPGTLFRWFDELRRTYESSLNSMQKKIERSQDESKQELKHQYETRIFELEENYQHQINNLKQSHNEQIKLLKRNILRLEKEIEFYQNQNVSQQKSLEQLNTRYDAIILALHHNNRADSSVQSTSVLPHQPEAEDVTTALTSNYEIETHCPHISVDWQIEALLDSAFQAREQKEFKIAFELFEQAAMLGSNKAMGALARSYFTAEGIEKNIIKAIAWLKLANAYQFEPAKQKLKNVSEEYPVEFSESDTLAQSLNEQIKYHLEEHSGYTEA